MPTFKCRHEALLCCVLVCIYICTIKNGILEIKKVQPQLTLYAFNTLQSINMYVTGGKQQFNTHVWARSLMYIDMLQIQFTWASK